MISICSLKNFTRINFFLILMAYIQYNVISFSSSEFVKDYTLTIVRNIFFVYIVDFLSINKKQFKNTDIVQKYNHEFLFDIIKSSLTECCTLFFIQHNLIFKNEFSFKEDLLYFIPVSFVFEIIFDFFHYITHRLFHEIPSIYFIHKHHHEHCNLKSVIAFHQNPIDLLVTNSFPFIVTLYLMSLIPCLNISIFTLCILDVYKVFIEICGHNGKESNSSSFPQFIWLPKLLNMELSGKNHYDHHIYVNYNYSKRFSLWDKIFGTFKE